MELSFSLLLLALTVQCVYWGIFMTGFMLIRSSGNNPTSGTSVVIAARNEYKNLKELLPLLLQQDHPDFEIIICNDRSNDRTQELIDQYDHFENVHFVTITRVPTGTDPKKQAIQKGIEKAGKEIILLTDADCRPQTRNWVTRMVVHFEPNTNFVIGYSGYRKKKGLLNYLIQFETLMTAIQFMGLGSVGYPYMGVGRNLAFRKEFFNSTGGYNDLLPITGGDDDLFVNRHANRKNTVFATGSDASTISEPKENIKDYFKQKKRHLSVSRYYNPADKFILGVFWLSYIFFWITFVYLAFVGGLNAAITSFLIRLFFIILTFTVAATKLEEKFNVWLIPVMDLLYLIYHTFTGLVAVMSRKVSWS